MTDRRQRQKVNRAVRKQEQRKVASRRELRRRLVTALGIGVGLVGVLVLTNLGGSDDQDTGLPRQYLAYRDQATACGAQAPPEETIMAFEAAVDQNLGAGPVSASISTSCGLIVIEFDSAFPQTVNSFVFLAREGFYNGTVIHRVVRDFAIQGGDQQADGTGDHGYLIPDEFPPEGFVYEEGVVAMANKGNGTTGSQFFFVVGPDARFLNNSFSVLGRVTSGQETLDKIEQAPVTGTPGTNERSRPTETVYINSIEISG